MIEANKNREGDRRNARFSQIEPLEETDFPLNETIDPRFKNLVVRTYLSLDTVNPLSLIQNGLQEPVDVFQNTERRRKGEFIIKGEEGVSLFHLAVNGGEVQQVEVTVPVHNLFASDNPCIIAREELGEIKAVNGAVVLGKKSADRISANDANVSMERGVSERVHAENRAYVTVEGNVPLVTIVDEDNDTWPYVTTVKVSGDIVSARLSGGKLFAHNVDTIVFDTREALGLLSGRVMFATCAREDQLYASSYGETTWLK